MSRLIFIYAIPGDSVCLATMFSIAQLKLSITLNFLITTATSTWIFMVSISKSNQGGKTRISTANIWILLINLRLTIKMNVQLPLFPQWISYIFHYRNYRVSYWMQIHKHWSSTLNIRHFSWITVLKAISSSKIQRVPWNKKYSVNSIWINQNAIQ